jgi:hypothetical protein
LKNYEPKKAVSRKVAKNANLKQPVNQTIHQIIERCKKVISCFVIARLDRAIQDRKWILPSGRRIPNIMSVGFISYKYLFFFAPFAALR